jgi:hypothetical protein
MTSGCGRSSTGVSWNGSSLLDVALSAARERLEEYDPDQPRDRLGRWTRVAPGEYRHSSGWQISRINYGYGDEWTAVSPDGDALDPLPTLARAKAAAEMDLADLLEYNRDQPRHPKGSERGGEWRKSVDASEYHAAQSILADFYAERPPETAPMAERQKFWSDYNDITSATRQPGGAPVRGEVIDLSDPRIPETVFHVTTNLPAVRSSGYLRAGGVGGLGGDKRDLIVSMTVSEDIAKDLEKHIRAVAELAKKYDYVPDWREFDWNGEDGQAAWDRFKGTARHERFSRALVADLKDLAKSEGWEWSGFVAKHQLRAYDFND